MTQYIDKSVVVAEIEKRQRMLDLDNPYGRGGMIELAALKTTLDTLQEQEVDLEKLGEIARHLIAIKDHLEDARLDDSEIELLEKIGYPERFGLSAKAKTIWHDANKEKPDHLPILHLWYHGTRCTDVIRDLEDINWQPDDKWCYLSDILPKED